MAEAIFEYKGNRSIIQCSKEDVIKNICLKFISKIDVNINHVYFLYNGDLINMKLKFCEVANKIDNDRNIMNILVFEKENDGIICPNCGENINIDINEIINNLLNSNDNIMNILNGIKDQMKSITTSKNNKINIIISQLKSIVYVINNINRDIKRNNEEINRINDIFNEINNKKQNKIEGVIDIEKEDINKDIIIYNSEEVIQLYINNEVINQNKYKFNKEGQYKFKLFFKNTPINLNRLFENCSQIYSIDLTNLDTSKVTNMYRMFHECNRLKQISGLNQIKTNNVSNMGAMFQDCHEIIYLDLSFFNTSKVNNMAGMFNGCHKLKEIKGLNKFDTSNVTKMQMMFNECFKLKELNGVELFNTKSVTEMNTMFQKCEELIFLDLSNFNTSNITDMRWMFNGCNKLKEIKGINKFNTMNVNYMQAMFQDCTELISLNLSNFNTSNVIDMSFMFCGCNKLEYLNIKNFKVNKNCNIEYIFLSIKEKSDIIVNDKELKNLLSIN